MSKSMQTRVEALERENFNAPPGRHDFARALREAHRRADAAGGRLPQTPITAEMMADPVHAELYRQMLEARERVRMLNR